MICKGKAMICKGKAMVYKGKIMIYIGKTMIYTGKTMIYTGKAMIYTGKAMICMIYTCKTQCKITKILDLIMCRIEYLQIITEKWQINIKRKR